MINGRFFIIGCERSGTTLVQAMLAQHSQVFTFPESHAFCRLVPTNSLYKRLGLANPKTAPQVLDELASRCLGTNPVYFDFPHHSIWLSTYVDAFVSAVDYATLREGKDIWVEKTPHHLFQVEAIQERVPGARFLHVVRDGRDVVASIRDASNSDRKYWGEWDVRRLAEHWNEAISESHRYSHDSRHFYVRYEDLLDHPEVEMGRICHLMQIGFEPSMLRHWESAEKVTGWMGSRPWMDMAHRPIQDTRLAKYTKVFTGEEQRYLETHLAGGGNVELALNGQQMELVG